MNEKNLVPTERRKLTYRGPRSHLWATGAKINHKIIITHIFRLRVKIAIKRISITKDQRKLNQPVNYFEEWM